MREKKSLGRPKKSSVVHRPASGHMRLMTWSSPRPDYRAGRIWLVGAGPGDPSLLTLKAVEVLRQADVLVHDRLIDPRVLDFAPATARRIYVGKMRARHALPQEDINQLLVDEAMAGQVVVRLKGGDPFVFGRGGEEADMARAAGIRVDIVPGITAAIGAAAAAQIPLTHREEASALTIITGHCKDGSEQDWRGIAGPGRTVVVYMGVAKAGQIARSLTDAGIAPDLPVAIIENATSERQRVFVASVDTMAGVILSEGIASPALLVIGDVARRTPQSLRALAHTAHLMAAE